MTTMTEQPKTTKINVSAAAHAGFSWYDEEIAELQDAVAALVEGVLDFERGVISRAELIELVEEYR